MTVALGKRALLTILVFPIPSLKVVVAQGDAIAVGPPQACGLTTFACSSASGVCCTAGTCCGSGCCASGYACINEGLSNEACCWSFDPTKCGTVPSASRGLGTPLNYSRLDSMAKHKSIKGTIAFGFIWLRLWRRLRGDPELPRLLNRPDLDLSPRSDVRILIQVMQPVH
ncbi:hypothetical protein Micbo1qcDRAFT_180684 [Microdochium bolleyi]|uniref:Granulins domain-containing protein n=1 Tax=Microdochium bolleyi TaxID=196109 RepID=A0A136IKX5_9PEZI|nr:hypothetical protein Micbo1qcDRAFT_180684 [Microdochium bolleyi]